MDGGTMRPVWRYSGRAVGAAAGLLTALPFYCLSAQDSVRISEAQTVLAHLVETYGVSSAEGPVREAVKRCSPPGPRARPTPRATCGCGSARAAPWLSSLRTWTKSVSA